MHYNKIKRIKILVNLLNKASNAYYNSDRSIMEDIEFDKLFDELKQLEQDTNYISSASPTINVGYEVKSKLQKVSHSIPLKSLGKTKDLNEINKFIGDKEVLIMLKGDGLTSEIIYENGDFKQGSTRGNSIIGEDISHNVKTYKNIPLKINFKGYLKLAGESVILDKDFELINSKLSEEEKYSNSRNLVAGSVRKLDSSICAKRNVNFMAFTLLECYDENKNKIEFKTLEEQFDFLGKLGFYIIPYMKFKKNKYDNEDIEDILANNINSLRKYATEKGIPIDGHVIKYNDIAYGLNLGETAHHPLNAIALKANNEEYETEYIKTEWQVSRSGLINPVGIFKPVNIDGADIERATLHNIDYFRNLELGKSDIITTIRSNQVIPKITGNLTRSNTETIPSICPVCGSKTEIRFMKTANVLYCTNENCSSRKVQQFSHFVSRDCLNIDGLSEATLEKFISKGFLKDLADIFTLEQYKKEIVSMEGMGLRSYNNLVKAIEKSKQCKLSNFLFSLGIPNIGKSTAKDLVKFVNGDNSLEKLNRIRLMCVQELLNMKDCGEITANAIKNWFDNDTNKQLLDKLLQYIEFVEDEKKVDISEVQDSPFKNAKVYPTGKFQLKKSELKIKLEELGATIASGYIKSLDYLICGGDMSKSGKADKAIKDGVKLMSEEEMMKYIK